MKFIITIDENKKLKETNEKAYIKSLTKFGSNRGKRKFEKVLKNAFGNDTFDLESVRTDTTFKTVTHNEKAARALYTYYRQIEALTVSLEIKSDIIKEEKED